MLAGALVFGAGAGTGVAANKYLITSIHQISPSVVKKLHGQRGPAGQPGPAGAAGTVGLGLTADQVLPAGSSEVGVWVGSGSNGESIVIPIEFRPRIVGPINPINIHVVTEATDRCAGSAEAPTAAPGDLCIYVGSSGTGGATFTSVRRLGQALPGADTLGGVLRWSAPNPGQAVLWGTWAYRDPRQSAA